MPLTIIEGPPTAPTSFFATNECSQPSFLAIKHIVHGAAFGIVNNLTWKDISPQSTEKIIRQLTKDPSILGVGCS